MYELISYLAIEINTFNSLFMILSGNYHDGDWVKEQKGYYHLCENCGESFIGRKNAIYCSISCKNKRNNDLKRERTKQFKEDNALYNKCGLALAQAHEHKEQITTTNIAHLISLGFKTGAPVKRLKFDQLDGIWRCIGEHAYQPLQDNQVKIININHWT